MNELLRLAERLRAQGEVLRSRYVELRVTFEELAWRTGQALGRRGARRPSLFRAMHRRASGLL